MSRMVSALRQLEAKKPVAAAPIQSPEPAPSPLAFPELTWHQDPGPTLAEPFNPVSFEPVDFDPYGADTSPLGSRWAPVADVGENDTPAQPVVEPAERMPFASPLFGSARSAPSYSGPLSLRFVDQNYQAVGGLIAALIEEQSLRTLVVHNVTVATDEVFSLPTLGRELAEQLARRVLLVSTDRRLRSLVEKPPADPLSGLTDALAGSIDWAQAVHRTVHPSLDLMPRGISALPGCSDRELHFPGALLAEYGCVLLGTSAQAVGFAAMAGRSADAVILAVRRQGTQREGLQQAAAALRSAGATLAGCIVLD